MLVDTSLATTAMPIVAGAQPNYQGPQKPYRGRSHCLMQSPELVERIDRVSADAEREAETKPTPGLLTRPHYVVRRLTAARLL